MDTERRGVVAKSPRPARLVLLLVVVAIGWCAAAVAAGNYTLVGWNNLGMHCLDGDYSVLSLLPPYNTIHAQLIDPQGKLVTDPTAAGIGVTYEGVADPDGSINTSSQGKTNFWQYVQVLFGAAPAVDVGLKGNAMPGASNQPQPMTFDPTAVWFIAEGIPITPYDDAHNKNTYPLMRLVARDRSGTVLASADIVLPVSDEMDCKTCHASGAPPAAQPAAGWVFDPDPQRDMRLNILRKHDDRQATDPVFQQALSAAGYNAGGLYQTVVTDKKSILCANCHLSEALPGTGRSGILPLTQAMHGLHSTVTDPVSGLALDSTNNRSACYRCHPGSVTRCLRGVMGSTVAADGTLAMQCQSCHGTLASVASPTRTGWLNEPVCQSCHTGTAVRNNGQLRYYTALDSSGQPRVAVDQTFATTPDVPGAGLSLYRFSYGHGGLTCEACHGSTHAEFASADRNDNLESIALQGHEGMLAECDTCHATQPTTVNGGPHGMHPIGQTWVNTHSNVVEGVGTAGCQTCHGTDYRGTVLSRTKADRTLTSRFGTLQLWRGFQVSCYACHAGPNGENASSNQPPVANGAAASTSMGIPVSVRLDAHDPNGNALTFRIVSQPDHGTVGLNGSMADYFPADGFAGTDAFTFAAWDGSVNSNLGTVSVTVGGSTGPDLTGRWVSLTQTCKQVGAQQRCTLKGRFVVWNDGTAQSGSSKLQFTLATQAASGGNDKLMKQLSVPKLVPGRSVTKNFQYRLPAGQSAADMFVLGLVDATRVVAETDESNNMIAFGPVP